MQNLWRENANFELKRIPQCPTFKGISWKESVWRKESPLSSISCGFLIDISFGQTTLKIELLGKKPKLSFISMHLYLVHLCFLIYFAFLLFFFIGIFVERVRMILRTKRYLNVHIMWGKMTRQWVELVSITQLPNLREFLSSFTFHYLFPRLCLSSQAIIVGIWPLFAFLRAETWMSSQCILFMSLPFFPTRILLL